MAEKSSGGTRVALDCLGCKLNQAEMESLARELIEAGYQVVATVDNPDVYILNTCTVTRTADSKSRHLLRMAHRRNPDARLVAMGCYAERASKELLRLEGVSLAVGNEQKLRLLRHLEDSGCLGRPACPGQASRLHGGGRTRAFIKVQDGCSRFCAYCIVPLVRGSEKSVPLGQVVGEVSQAVTAGFREVVLTGTEIGSYSDKGVSLAGLLEHILAYTGVTRLRLSSLQPQEISPGLIGLWHDGRLCPHFHLSLQSGSDSVLRRMKRCYSIAGYRRAVSMISEVLPEAAITTDIIVGFPGETGTEFEESTEFCGQMGFARVHVFPYSVRQGTEAALMPHQVSDTVKRERGRRMLALAADSARRFRQRFLGKTAMVLWEKQSAGVWSGLTDNYVRVFTRNDGDLTNRLLPAKLVELKGDGVWGGIAD